MSAIFSATERAYLGQPHVARCWFAMLDLPSGIAYLHNGYGKVENLEGHDWIGVSDPAGGRLVSVGEVTEPTFGQAAAIVLQISGVDADFVASVRQMAREIEGRPAEIYTTLFDGETQAVLSSLKRMFPLGRMSAPSIQWQGIGRRTVSITVESIWSSLNFSPGGRWNGADQRRRYPGDKGLDFVGQDINEAWIN